jgi:hypothetical protein
VVIGVVSETRRKFAHELVLVFEERVNWCLEGGVEWLLLDTRPADFLSSNKGGKSSCSKVDIDTQSSKNLETEVNTQVEPYGQ